MVTLIIIMTQVTVYILYSAVPTNFFLTKLKNFQKLSTCLTFLKSDTNIQPTETYHKSRIIIKKCLIFQLI
jgi:hypothetical protein